MECAGFKGTRRPPPTQRAPLRTKQDTPHSHSIRFTQDKVSLLLPNLIIEFNSNQNHFGHHLILVKNNVFNASAMAIMSSACPSLPTDGHHNSGTEGEFLTVFNFWLNTELVDSLRVRVNTKPEIAPKGIAIGV